jgi:hypothetical protein
MARLVYIPEVDPTTYLHLSMFGKTVRFRDFSKSATDRPEPFCPAEITREVVEQYVIRKAGYNLPNQPKEMVDPGVTSPQAIKIWHECIVEINMKIPPDRETERKRLEILHKKQQLNILWWRKVRLIIAVATAFLALLVAIAGYWNQIIAFFSASNS